MRRSLLYFLLLIIIIATHSLIYAQSNCVDVTGTPTVNPLSLDFGEVEVGKTSSTKTFQLANVDRTSPMQVTEINSLNSRFQIVSAPSLPFCLAPAESVTIGVQFVPLSEGLVVSRIHIKTSDENIDVDTAGTGVAGGGGGVNLKVSPGSIDFGQVNVGSDSSKSFNITNQGSSSVTIDKINSNNNAFRVTSPSFPRNIGGGGSINVTAEFDPSKAGNFDGDLSIVVANKTVASVRVFGVGFAGNPDIDLSTLTVSFGAMDAGTFKTENITVSNTGKTDLDVAMPADSFLKPTPQNFSVRPGKSVTVQLKFIADLVGNINKKYIINSNDPDERKLQLTITANGQKGAFGFIDRTVRSKIAGNPNRTSAIQLVDFNKDGKEDLYLTGFDGNLMCQNTGGAVFTNSTARNKLANNGADARGVSWGDVDNDGDLDAFIANFNAPAAVLKNNGGVFAAQTNSLGIFATDNTPKSRGGIWVDFNNDKLLDIFIVKDGAQNQLFKNVGGFQFANVAASAHVNFTGPGRGAIAADFNDDGFQDLYVVNFQRPNKLYLNNGNETFRDATASSGAGFSGASQQAAAVDYDGDEDIDIFVVNNNGPSLLFRNQGNGKFQNVAGAAGLAGPKKGRSASFNDYDHDGDVDVIITQSQGGNLLFSNVGGGRFNRITNVDLGNADNPTGTGNGDTDNDGDVDVVIGDGDGGSDSGDSVYQNSGGGNNNWLVVTLQGTTSNRSAIGTKVIVRIGVILQAGIVSAGNGNNQDTLPLEFGVGSATSAQVIIVWPNGNQEVHNDVAVNRKITFTEGQLE
ncbi:MAG TPA: FG-GAP-like repeat-containing protein [Acidobacteriota bacterium]|nr:FG-GAP-like repeat-containing protein [Acidobacteriota bacterium]